MDIYYYKLIQQIAIFFLVIAAGVWGIIGTTKVNLIEKFLGKSTIISRGIYILMGLSALLLAFDRDTYLPFLGDSVFPHGVLQDQTPSGATRSVNVRVKPNVKVVFWATEPGDNLSVKNYKGAYNSYRNSGVTTADNDGNAVLIVREPQPYTVPTGYLKSHIHYRECDKNGFIGPVKSTFINSQV